MLFTLLLTTLLLNIPSTTSLPTISEPYNCGYVLTQHNSSAYAGIYAHNFCEPFFYNDTIHNYQDAFAYKVYGGCECQFYGIAKSCIWESDTPVVRGPSGDNRVLDFQDPKPTWYKCWKAE